MALFEPKSKSFSQSNYGVEKLDKKKQLTPDMSIVPTAPDEYTQKIRNVGGSNNAEER